MARKAIVNKDEILSMLREGETTRSIAEKFNVSRQAIDLHRKDFIEKGLLPDKRAVRVKEQVKETAPQNQSPISTSPPPLPDDAASLDAQIDLMISAFNALKRLPQLEKEVETYKQQYEQALTEIESLKETERKRLNQESRWRLTQSQDDTEPA